MSCEAFAKLHDHWVCLGAASGTWRGWTLGPPFNWIWLLFHVLSPQKMKSGPWSTTGTTTGWIWFESWPLSVCGDESRLISSRWLRFGSVWLHPAFFSETLWSGKIKNTFDNDWWCVFTTNYGAYIAWYFNHSMSTINCLHFPPNNGFDWQISISGDVSDVSGWGGMAGTAWTNDPQEASPRYHWHLTYLTLAATCCHCCLSCWHWWIAIYHCYNWYIIYI